MTKAIAESKTQYEAEQKVARANAPLPIVPLSPNSTTQERIGYASSLCFDASQAHRAVVAHLLKTHRTCIGPFRRIGYSIASIAIT